MILTAQKQYKIRKKKTCCILLNWLWCIKCNKCLVWDSKQHYFMNNYVQNWCTDWNVSWSRSLQSHFSGPVWFSTCSRQQANHLRIALSLSTIKSCSIPCRYNIHISTCVCPYLNSDSGLLHPQKTMWECGNIPKRIKAPTTAGWFWSLANIKDVPPRTSCKSTFAPWEVSTYDTHK